MTNSLTETKNARRQQTRHFLNVPSLDILHRFTIYRKNKKEKKIENCDKKATTQMVRTCTERQLWNNGATRSAD